MEFLRLWSGRLLLTALFAFAVYSNIQVAIRNHQLNQRVDQDTAQLNQEDLRNQKLKLLLAYYQSPSYQDVEARRRLGLKKPDENVVVIKGLNQQAQLDDGLEQLVYTAPSGDSSNGSTAGKSNLKQWLDYFTGKKK